jgi:ERCC4-type nuclease
MELVIVGGEKKLRAVIEKINPDINYCNEPILIGDIHIRDKETKEIKLLIERKTYRDLYGSIKDGRHREQKKRILEHVHYSNVFFLIEGSIHVEDFDEKQRNIINGAILNTMLRDKCQIIYSSSPSESIDLILSYYKKITDNPDWYGGLKETTDYVHLVKLKKKDNITPIICQQYFLAQIPGMSIGNSVSILDKYKNIQELIHFLSTGEQSITELSNHELKTKTGKKRKLGKKMAQRIYSTLFLDEEIYF